ncbi:unnamed protein product [Linum trigynum]|uniref:Uncharacterized protein n=1 Tax=Linum trigynum TaxID=586398 RepID=A0AAV2CE23_9ROSI
MDGGVPASSEDDATRSPSPTRRVQETTRVGGCERLQVENWGLVMRVNRSNGMGTKLPFENPLILHSNVMWEKECMGNFIPCMGRRNEERVAGVGVVQVPEPNWKRHKRDRFRRESTLFVVINTWERFFFIDPG